MNDQTVATTDVEETADGSVEFVDLGDAMDKTEGSIGGLIFDGMGTWG